MELRKQKRQKLRSALINGQNIAIDFNLPNIMTDKVKTVNALFLVIVENSRNAMVFHPQMQTL